MAISLEIKAGNLFLPKPKAKEAKTAPDPLLFNTHIGGLIRYSALTNTVTEAPTPGILEKNALVPSANVTTENDLPLPPIKAETYHPKKWYQRLADSVHNLLHSTAKLEKPRGSQRLIRVAAVVAVTLIGVTGVNNLAGDNSPKPVATPAADSQPNHQVFQIVPIDNSILRAVLPPKVIEQSLVAETKIETNKAAVFTNSTAMHFLIEHQLHPTEGLESLFRLNLNKFMSSAIRTGDARSQTAINELRIMLVNNRKIDSKNQRHLQLLFSATKWMHQFDEEGNPMEYSFQPGS